MLYSILMILAIVVIHNVVFGRPAVESLVEHRADELITLPFYGGAKGQLLQIRRKPNGSIASEIIKQNPLNADSNVALSFEENLANIQKAAAELVNLQQNIKQSGQISSADQKLYAENLEKLGVSAQNLAHIQQSGSSFSDDFRLLFDGINGNRIQKPMIIGDSDGTINEEQPTKNPQKNEDEDVGEEQDTTEENAKPTEDTESVGINSSDKDSSIAEAKPVGIAIAGEGGLASSKPSATAIVGPGGLAIAKPIATAIAGVAPNEISSLGIPLGQKIKQNLKEKFNQPIGKKYGLASVTSGVGRPVLVGPNFYEEPRKNEKYINAIDKNNASVVVMDNNNTNHNNSVKFESSIINDGSDVSFELYQQQQQQQQYPFIPPMVPLRFKWDTEPIVDMPGYEPIPFLDNRALHSQPFPFPYQHIPSINPFQYYNPQI